MFHELLHLSTLPRRITFPFPLAIFSCSEGLAAGHVVRRLESELEFCFRLGSTEKEAEDCIDDHVYRTGFPFLLIRKPDKQHMHRISGVREALSLYYNGNLMEKFEDVGFDLTLPGRPFVRTTEIDGLVSRMRGLTGIIELPGIVEKMDLLAFQLLETVFLQVQAGGMGAVSSEEERVRRIASYFQLHFSEKNRIGSSPAAVRNLAQKLLPSLAGILSRTARPLHPQPALQRSRPPAEHSHSSDGNDYPPMRLFRPHSLLPHVPDPFRKDSRRIPRTKPENVIPELILHLYGYVPLAERRSIPLFTPFPLPAPSHGTRSRKPAVSEGQKV